MSLALTPYFEQVLKQWAMQLQTHYDWSSILKAVIEAPVFLQWHSAYEDATETQVYTYLQYGLTIPLDMLISHCQYTDQISQSMIDQHAYFLYVFHMAFRVPKDSMCYF